MDFNALLEIPIEILWACHLLHHKLSLLINNVKVPFRWWCIHVLHHKQYVFMIVSLFTTIYDDRSYWVHWFYPANTIDIVFAWGFLSANQNIITHLTLVKPYPAEGPNRIPVFTASVPYRIRSKNMTVFGSKLKLEKQQIHAGNMENWTEIPTCYSYSKAISEYNALSSGIQVQKEF